MNHANLELTKTLCMELNAKLAMLGTTVRTQLWQILDHLSVLVVTTANQDLFSRAQSRICVQNSISVLLVLFIPWPVPMASIKDKKAPVDATLAQQDTTVSMIKILS